MKQPQIQWKQIGVLRAGDGRWIYVETTGSAAKSSLAFRSHTTAPTHSDAEAAEARTTSEKVQAYCKGPQEKTGTGERSLPRDAPTARRLAISAA